MIYVLTYPDRIIDKIKYQLFGTMPTYEGDEIRYGGGMAELITHANNSCHAIQMAYVVDIFFDGGYSEALAKVQKEARENIGALSGFGPTEEQEDVGDIPYNPEEVKPMDKDGMHSYL